MERTTRTAMWGRLAAVLLLLFSLVGGLPANPAFAGRAVTALSAVDPGCPPATADGQIVYGCNELSRNLQRARLWLQQNKPPGTTDKLFKNAGASNYAIARLRDGTYVIGYSDNVAHSEERLLNQMNGKSQRIVFDPATGRVSYQAPKASPIVEGFSDWSRAPTSATRNSAAPASGRSSPTPTSGTAARVTARTRSRRSGTGPTTRRPGTSPWR